MIPSLKEKRQFPRINLNVPLCCRVLGKKEIDNTVSSNISLGGLGFTNNRFIAPNTTVNLEINLLSKVINTTARIAQISGLAHCDKFRLGAEFTGLEPRQQRFISDYIDMRMDKL